MFEAVTKKLQELATYQATADVLDTPVLKMSPNLATFGHVACMAGAGIFAQATPSDDTPGVVTLREIGEEFGKGIRQYAQAAVEKAAAK